MIIKKVWETKKGQKIVSIPKESLINKGEFVQISKIVVEENSILEGKGYSLSAKPSRDLKEDFKDE